MMANSVQPRINQTFKNLIPPLTTDEFSLLERNILKDGIREPIVLWGETIVDGHNRYELAQKHRLTFDTVSIEFENEATAKMWIIDNQLGRRNLTDALRIDLALLKEPLIQAQAKANQIASGGAVVQKSSKPPVVARDLVAKLAGVSHDTVTRYKKVKEYATPEILEAVKCGEKKIGTAFREIQTGTKVCAKCGEEKPLSRFPSSGASSCLDCKVRKHKDPEMEETIRHIRREVKSTNKQKAMEVVYGWEFQLTTYLKRFTDALANVPASEERQEVITEFSSRCDIIKNYVEELK